MKMDIKMRKKSEGIVLSFLSFILIVVFVLLCQLADSAELRSMTSSTDQINWGSSTTLTMDNSFTFCGWYENTDSKAWAAIISKDSDYFFTQHGTQHSKMRSNNDSGTLETAQFGSNLTTLSFWCARWDKDDDSGNQTIYQNGTLKKTGGASTSAISTNTNDVLTYSGDGTDTQKFSNIHVYERKLSTQEMTEIRWRPGIIANELRLWAPLWGDSTEPDLSGNGNDGTLTGTSTTTDDDLKYFVGGGT